MRSVVWKAIAAAALLGATVALLDPRGGIVGPSFPFADKLQHVALFAALALLAAFAWRDKPRWGIFAALVLYGAAIEVAQAHTGRSGEALDLLADALGASVVFALSRHDSSGAGSSPARPS